jgi:hypothetical protein
MILDIREELEAYLELDDIELTKEQKDTVCYYALTDLSSLLHDDVFSNAVNDVKGV